MLTAWKADLRVSVGLCIRALIPGFHLFCALASRIQRTRYGCNSDAVAIRSFAHSLFTLSLKVAHFKERPWAIRSRRSLQKSDREQLFFEGRISTKMNIVVEWGNYCTIHLSWGSQIQRMHETEGTDVPLFFSFSTVKENIYLKKLFLIELSIFLRLKVNSSYLSLIFSVKEQSCFYFI